MSGDELPTSILPQPYFSIAAIQSVLIIYNELLLLQKAEARLSEQETFR